MNPMQTPREELFFSFRLWLYRADGTRGMVHITAQGAEDALELSKFIICECGNVTAWCLENVLE
jgi:hypothetical protein